MSTIAQVIASVIVSLGTVAAAYLVARRFQRLGGGEAQERLNGIRKELDDAMTQKVQLLEDQFKGCKTRLIEVEDELKRLRRERTADRREISDLHAELRKLQPDRLGRQDRSDD